MTLLVICAEFGLAIVVFCGFSLLIRRFEKRYEQAVSKKQQERARAERKYQQALKRNDQLAYPRSIQLKNESDRLSEVIDELKQMDFSYSPEVNAEI